MCNQIKLIWDNCFVIKSFLTLSDPMDCSSPGSSVHGIFEASILELVAIYFSILDATYSLLVLYFKAKLERSVCSLCPHFPSNSNIILKWLFLAIVTNDLSVSYLFMNSSSWGSQGKNAEVVCHSFLQWTTFCQNSPPWPIHPYMTWFIVSLS